MASWYIIRHAGSELSRGVLNQARKAVCPGGCKRHKSVHRRKEIAAARPKRDIFLKLAPHENLVFCPHGYLLVPVRVQVQVR
jgi:hypothetical protein